MTGNKMNNQIRESLLEFSADELERELFTRGAIISGEKQFKLRGSQRGTRSRKVIISYDDDPAPSPNKALGFFSTEELIKGFTLKTKKKPIRGRWNKDDRIDSYKITDEKTRNKADCVAAICLKDNLIDHKNGYSTLKVKHFGETFNLCEKEPFREQPISEGTMCTGFLVAEDIIATAGHCADKNNAADLRIVFGFKMADDSTPIITLSNKNIYKGKEIFHRIYNRFGNGADWALVKLDRKVSKQTIRLSRKMLCRGQDVYVIGHPVGLPLKYAPGARVTDIFNAVFVADLDVYMGNSGSPVFDRETHEVIGIVVRGDSQDFKPTKKGWGSVIYPNQRIKSIGSQCTKVSEFIDCL